MPLSVSMKPRNFPSSTSNTHLYRLNFKLYFAIILNSSSRSATRWSFSFDVTTMSSTYVCLYVSLEDRGEDPIHQPLIGSANIFKAKGHDLVAIVGELGHKGRLTLVPQEHTDLVVSRERIQEA